MIIDLSKLDFENDMFSTIIPGNSILLLNKIDESLKIGSMEEGVSIKAINIEINSFDGQYTKCSNIIGLSNDYFKIETKYKEYEGEVLTSDNMKYCTIEVYES